MATHAIIRNDELVSSSRKNRTFQKLSDFHQQVEMLTNMKLIQGVPDSFKTKVKSQNFYVKKAQEMPYHPSYSSLEGKSIEVADEATNINDNWDMKSDVADPIQHQMSVKEMKSITPNNITSNSVDKMLDEEMQMRALENQVVEEMSPVKVKDSIDHLVEEFVDVTNQRKEESEPTTHVPVA